MGLFGPPDVKELRGRRDVKTLIKALGHRDAGLRGSAADALGAIRDAQAVAPLIAALTDVDAGVRKSAAEALGDLADARAFHALITALADKHGPVRYFAARALGKIGDARAVAPLNTALADHDERVRWKAAVALDQLGAPPPMSGWKLPTWRVSDTGFGYMEHEEKLHLVRASLAWLQDKHSDSDFGYLAFPIGRLDRMVVSTIFHELKEAGEIRSTGYETFRLARR